MVGCRSGGTLFPCVSYNNCCGRRRRPCHRWMHGRSSRMRRGGRRSFGRDYWGNHCNWLYRSRCGRWNRVQRLERSHGWLLYRDGRLAVNAHRRLRRRGLPMIVRSYGFEHVVARLGWRPLHRIWRRQHCLYKLVHLTGRLIVKVNMVEMPHALNCLYVEVNTLAGRYYSSGLWL